MSKNYLVFPKMDPIIISIGPVSLHWYGLMYLIGFFFAMWLAVSRIGKINGKWTRDAVETLLFVGFLGAFIGGRLGYVIFYNLALCLDDPLYLFKVWHGGMSFHGGLIGAILVIAWFSNQTHRPFLQVSDFVAPLIPFGLGAGRLGNFINGELWGRVTIDTPWAMLFPGTLIEDKEIATGDLKMLSLLNKYGALPRHPSQLYEFFLEGIALFIILNLFSIKKRPLGAVSGLFLLGYGIFRIISETFRQPDAQIGLFNNIMSMGQLLSIPMVVVGIMILILAYHRREKTQRE